MVNRRQITHLKSPKVEVLNEGKIRKRKHQRADRCHRDDEKERRNNIAAQFAALKLFLPKTKKNRTRQEVLSCTRELIWELWRNEEILSLASVNQMESKIAELEKLVVMKRDKKRQLESIKRTAVESMVTDYGVVAESEEVETVELLDVTPCLSQTAEIVTDHEIVDRTEGYVLEEVLPPDLYDQLVNSQLELSESEQNTPSGNYLKDPNDAISEALKIVQDTYRVEEINNDNTSSANNKVTGGEPSDDEIAEVNVCNEAEFERVYPEAADQETGDPPQTTYKIEGGHNCEGSENMPHCSRSRVSSPLEVNNSDNSGHGESCGNFDYSLTCLGNENRTSDDSPYPKFPLSMPPFNQYFMPFQLWPTFVQPEQMAGYPGPGIPMSLVPNPSCAYSSLPAPLINSPPRSSLDMLVSPEVGGPVVMNDYMVSEVTGNADLDVVN